MQQPRLQEPSPNKQKLLLTVLTGKIILQEQQ